MKKRWVVLLAVFCLLGFKRILLMAMLIGIIVYFCARRAKKAEFDYRDFCDSDCVEFNVGIPVFIMGFVDGN